MWNQNRNQRGAAHDPRLREFHYRFSAERHKSLIDVIKEGAVSGEFTADVDPELARSALLEAIFCRRLMSAKSFAPSRAGELVDTVLTLARQRRTRQ
jgi:hypothetical protein